jgi:chromosome segregation ATPase
MKQELSPDQGYLREQEQQAADVADLHISHDRANVEQIEGRIAQEKDRQEAAREMLKIAERVLAGPPQLDITRAARADKADADKVIRETAENIAQLEEKLSGVKNRLAVWEARRKEINPGVLRAGRMLDALRNRMKGR